MRKICVDHATCVNAYRRPKIICMEVDKLASPSSPASLAKILFNLEASDWHVHGTESLWAEPVSGGRFKLRNTPFYAKGISFEDIVFVEILNDLLMYRSTSIAGGHSTYRILSDTSISNDDFLSFWHPIEIAGCTYESSSVGKMVLLAVDVPPNADIHDVYRLLDEGEKKGVWEFEEGHRGHPV